MVGGRLDVKVICAQVERIPESVSPGPGVAGLEPRLRFPDAHQVPRTEPALREPGLDQHARVRQAARKDLGRLARAQGRI